MRRPYFFASVLALFLAVPLAAHANPPPVAQVREMLSGYESVPSRDAWQRLGPETVGVLAQLYNDRSQPPFVRIRAVAAAGSFATPAARTFLRGVLRLRGQSDLIAREALLALATAFGGEAMADVRPYVTDASPVLRAGAARALGRIRSNDALAVLQQRATVETDGDVREAIRLALADTSH